MTIVTTVYALHDPSSGAIRYIGKTTGTPQRRLVGHLSEAKRLQDYRSKWVRSILQAGLRPTMTVLEEVIGTLADGSLAERKWIAAHRGAGASLTNGTDGGEGMIGWVPSP